MPGAEHSPGPRTSGNSVGAVLATETAASFPERVDKLTLVGAPVWNAFTAKERLADTMAQYDDRRAAQGRARFRTSRTPPPSPSPRRSGWTRTTTAGPRQDRGCGT